MRDFQQAKVYAAEHAVQRTLDFSGQAATYNFHGSMLTIPVELKFGTIEATQQYVDKVLGKGEVKVVIRRGNSAAHYLAGEIAVPAPVHGKHWAQRELVVLHECAHHLARGDSHGPRFVAAFLNLVREHIGPEAHLMLLDAFTETGVKYATQAVA